MTSLILGLLCWLILLVLLRWQVILLPVLLLVV